MHWVTSRKIRINRAATVWLIRRFIDPDAHFVFVGPGEVALEAHRLAGIGFHAPGTAYRHAMRRGAFRSRHWLTTAAPTMQRSGA